MHSTNYRDTFIAVAPDSTATRGTEPPVGKSPSIAFRTFRILREAPYRYTSDDVLFMVHAERNGIAAKDLAAARAGFFAKGQACLRASDLAKRYGWGIHHDGEGRVALFGVESREYQVFLKGEGVTVKYAMRSRR